MPALGSLRKLPNGRCSRSHFDADSDGRDNPLATPEERS